MNRVFGIGWARTGTTTLGACFQILGYDHQGQKLDLIQDIPKGNMSRIFSLAEKKESFDDWPWIILYRELDAAFPGSQFVLTTREPEKWLRSYQNMLANQGRASTKLNKQRHILYSLPFPDVSADELVQRYTRHNREVTHYFCNRPNDLLVLDWEKRSGWEEICGFLGKEVPDEPFPHAHRSGYTKSIRRRFTEATDWVKRSLR